MRIVFCSFQGISRENQPLGMVRVLQPLFQKIGGHCMYYVGFNKGDGPEIGVNRFNEIVGRGIGFFCRRVGLHVGIIRYLQEFLYDIFLCLKLERPVILVSTAYVPRSAKKNRLSGGVNLFLAGNARDEFIRDLLIEEQRKWGLKFDDAYTYSPRIEFINRYLDLQDFVVSQTAVTHATYLKSGVGTRFVLCESDLIPDTWKVPSTTVVKPESVEFIFVAHIVWLKGLKYLLDAWKELARPRARLTVVGGIQPDLDLFFKQIDLPTVNFVGAKSASELSQFYSRSHVCIVPSLIDNHPATIAEAMIFGLLVIATDGCGSKTLISEGETGFVVPPADSVALLEKIRWCCDNVSKVFEMGVRSRRSILSVDKGRPLDELSRLIKSVSEA